LTRNVTILSPHPAGRIVPGQSVKQRIKAYIHDHLRDPDLNLDHIAAALVCSKRYLHMAFAGEGLTIEKYLWTERLERCRQDLESAAGSALTVTEIAFSWGFNSSSHFSRLFKQRFGLPPSLLLRQVRGRAAALAQRHGLPKYRACRST